MAWARARGGGGCSVGTDGSANYPSHGLIEIIINEMMGQPTRCMDWNLSDPSAKPSRDWT